MQNSEKLVGLTKQILTEATSESKFGIVAKKNKETSTEDVSVTDFIMNGTVIGSLKKSKRQVSVGRRSTTKQVYDYNWNYKGLAKELGEPAGISMGAAQVFHDQYQTAIRSPENIDYMIKMYKDKHK